MCWKCKIASLNLEKFRTGRMSFDETERNIAIILQGADRSNNHRPIVLTYIFVCKVENAAHVFVDTVFQYCLKLRYYIDITVRTLYNLDSNAAIEDRSALRKAGNGQEKPVSRKEAAELSPKSTTRSSSRSYLLL
ncbi:hypothetical protein NQZ79_g2426 [Umbelopsis isabellina]|nr:hypothetical protein NQZ79_g2426 [Umbelopsis isabellina]